VWSPECLYTYWGRNTAFADGKYTTRIPEGVTDEEKRVPSCAVESHGVYTACKRSAVKPRTVDCPAGDAGGRSGPFCRPVCKGPWAMRVILPSTAVTRRRETSAKRLGAEKPTSTSPRAKDIAAEGYGADQSMARMVVLLLSRRRRGKGYESAPGFLRPGRHVGGGGLLPKDPDPSWRVRRPLMLALKRLQIVGSVVGHVEGCRGGVGTFTARGPCSCEWPCSSMLRPLNLGHMLT
jgi:hypothetical protein